MVFYGWLFVSATISELHKQYYELVYILNYNVYNEQIEAYFRNVDDIFILFKGIDGYDIGELASPKILNHSILKIFKNINYYNI